MALSITLKRPLCEHIVGETVCEILESVLYYRNQIPVLTSALLASIECNENSEYVAENVLADVARLRAGDTKIERFRATFLAARDAIRVAFQTTNRTCLSRFAIVIGASTHFPADVYLVEFEFCPCASAAAQRNALAEKAESPAGNYCGCSLRDMERRHIARQVIESGVCLHRSRRDFQPLKRASKTFLFVQADRKEAVLPGFLPRPDLDWRETCTEERRGRTVNWNIVKLKCSGEKNGADVVVENVGKIMNETDSIWFQYQDSIMGFDEK